MSGVTFFDDGKGEKLRGSDAPFMAFAPGWGVAEVFVVTSSRRSYKVLFFSEEEAQQYIDRKEYDADIAAVEQGVPCVDAGEWSVERCWLVSDPEVGRDWRWLREARKRAEWIVGAPPEEK